MKKILYLFTYGDQHHRSSADQKKGKKVISDGGSNIHTHFLLRIQKRFKIFLFTYQDNYQAGNFFSRSEHIIIKEFPTLSGLFNTYLLWIEIVTRCIYPGSIFAFKKFNVDYVVTQSDFLPDTWAAFLLKLRNPHIQWIASFFLKAPAPWDKNSPYKGIRRPVGFFYWLFQLPSIFMIKLKADKVMVTSKPDVKRFFSPKRDLSKIVVVQGGVDTDESEIYLNSGFTLPPDERKYDACFLGRLHDQKGVMELVDIWKHVCEQKQDAKLIIMGGGPLERDIRHRIAHYGLQSNIELAGYVYGKRKYDIFKQSKMILHPAVYDSGGMAAAEGMAWGLPGVSFDLEALKTYYPKGVLKVPCGNHGRFAEKIMTLLKDRTLYQQTADRAAELIHTVWSWNVRAQMMADTLLGQGE